MGIFDDIKEGLIILNILLPAKPKHTHNWIQFSKLYHNTNSGLEWKERCKTCFRVRYYNTHNYTNRFTISEAIQDEILGFMRYAFKN